MVENKRKKSSRTRGHTTHGFGSMKKNRGAGNRGGRGNAGSGKRGDAKKPSLTWKKGHKHKGKVGFKTYTNLPDTKINISDIPQKINSFIEKKFAQKKGDLFIINLKGLKYNKLLGSGKVNYKYEITVDYASKLAIEKIKSAGGKVILLSKDKSTELNTKEEKAEKPSN